MIGLRRPVVRAGLAAASCVALVTVPAPVLAADGNASPLTYVNPVSQPFADTFADPSLIRGKDGYWYSYATSDPLRHGDTAPHTVPTARSTNLVDWTFVGDAFTPANRPVWAAPGAGIWAPDIRYVDGEYRMYYVVTDTVPPGGTDEPNDNAVGMATAPTPAGPWTDSGAPVVGPRRGGAGEPGNFLWSFDPSVVSDRDGSQWLFYGSYYGGIYVQELTADGRRATARPPVMVAIDNKFEGAYVVRHGAYWYLFASTANCCAGPTTGYSVQVGRSTDLRGPYLDREGVPLTASRAGGTPTLVQNGNRWIGSGHNAIATDVAGQEWIVYHAVDRDQPYLNGTDGVNTRPMLMDRLDWVAGWPEVNAGQGPSDTPRPGPVTGRTNFDDGLGELSPAGRWTLRSGDPQAGSYAESQGAGVLVDRNATAGDLRVEADLRSSSTTRYGLVVGAHPGQPRAGVTADIDPLAGVLRLREGVGSQVLGSATVALPAGFRAQAWHSLALEVRDGKAYATLTHARLGDPLASTTLTLSSRGSQAGFAGIRAGAAGVDADNLSAVTPAARVDRVVPTYVPGRLSPAGSDEFRGGTLGAGWQWVREDPAAHVADGSLVWPTEAADLTGPGNTAGVLLRAAPDGPWTVETRLTIDTGTDAVRNFQQGGLIAYVDDDLFTRLSHVAIFNTRQVEFGKEMPYAGRLSYGGTIVGSPAATTYLRIVHAVDPVSGEHTLRAYSRREGGSWVKGGVWTLPAGATIRVGLISHGGAGATSSFDYFRTYTG